MAKIDDAMAELRHRIMRSFESGPPKNDEGQAMTQSVNIEYERHGSAAVALRRLARPERECGAVVEDDPVSNPERDGAVVVGDELSELFKRLSRDMPD
jgi:hypothetical protein